MGDGVDVVARLRSPHFGDGVRGEAADEIVRLRLELGEARAQLYRAGAAVDSLVDVVDARGEAVELLRQVRRFTTPGAIPGLVVENIDRVLAAVDQPHEQDEQ